MERQDEIRLLAYQIWQDEGRPHGRDLDHWLKAETIWQGRQRQEVLAAQSPLAGRSPSGEKRRSRNKARLPSRAKAK